MNRALTLKTLLFFFVTALLCYGRTLNYDFVYDDYWRILHNPAVQEIQPIHRYFTDPTTQAGTDFRGHTWRPLSTIIQSLNFQIYQQNPAGYRIQNIFLHSLNATLAVWIAVSLLGISPGAATVGALFFLIQPVQAESVVWICELSNVLALSFILLGIACWTAYLKTRLRHFLWFFYLSFIFALTTRENGVSLVPIIALIHLIHRKRKSAAQLIPLMGIALSYLLIRGHLLGKFAQQPLWGGTIISNIENVMAIFLFSIKTILWPSSLRIIYSTLPIYTGGFHLTVLFGTALCLALITLAGASFKKFKELTFCIGAFLFFWAPSSGIVPLNTLFAERFLYPMLIPIAWVVGLIIDKTNKNVKWLFSLIIVIHLMTLQRILPVWKNEISLWKNAIRYEPFSWGALASLGDAYQLAHFKRGHSGEPAIQNDLETAREYYLKALENNPPEDNRKAILKSLSNLDSLINSDSNKDGK